MAVTDLSGLWAFGLTSARTGEALIEIGGEHELDRSQVSLGFNLVTDSAGNLVNPSAAPLSAGDKLIVSDTLVTDNNTSEYANVFSIMAPIRDAILYQFDDTSKADWEALTAVLTLNNIKTTDGETVLSTDQVYDFVAAGPTDGNPVLQYLEEAELDLKCLAFTDFDFTNPEGGNQCVDNALVQGSGILGASVNGQLLIGTDTANTLSGGAGNDTISGGVADDSLSGGDGVDRLAGIDGTDTLFGGGGADVLYGNQGLDVLFGGDGDDVLFGGQNSGELTLGESDTTALRDGTETLSGGAGNDIVYGNHGSDLLYGGSGADAFFGGQENDTLFGNDGNDTLGGNRGNDLLQGGNGADRFDFSSNGGADTIGDFSITDGDKISATTGRLSVVDSSDGAVITFDGGYTVTLTGVSASEVNDGFFV